MRNALALATLACLMISGCSSSDDNGDGGNGTTTTGMDGGNGGGATTTSPAPGPAGNLTHYDCTATVGAAGISGNGVGGCNMNNGDGIPSNGIVRVLTPATGCHIEYDENDDNQADGVAEVDAEYEEGTSFTAFCDPTMPPNSTSSMDIQLVA